MNLQENTTFYNQLLMNSIVGTALTFSSITGLANEPMLSSTVQSKFVEYDSPKQSTQYDSFLRNDIGMLKIIEISKLNDKIKNLYQTSIEHSWIPADGKLKKTCLFVKVKNQEELISKESDFELNLYLNLKTELKESNFFNMIALI